LFAAAASTIVSIWLSDTIFTTSDSTYLLDVIVNFFVSILPFFVFGCGLVGWYLFGKKAQEMKNATGKYTLGSYALSAGSSVGSLALGAVVAYISIFIIAIALFLGILFLMLTIISEL